MCYNLILMLDWITLIHVSMVFDKAIMLDWITLIHVSMLFDKGIMLFTLLSKFKVDM